jgi:hypothetical protein
MSYFYLKLLPAILTCHTATIPGANGTVNGLKMGVSFTIKIGHFLTMNFYTKQKGDTTKCIIANSQTFQKMYNLHIILLYYMTNQNFSTTNFSDITAAVNLILLYR